MRRLAVILGLALIIFQFCTFVENASVERYRVRSGNYGYLRAVLDLSPPKEVQQEQETRTEQSTTSTNDALEQMETTVLPTRQRSEATTVLATVTKPDTIELTQIQATATATTTPQPLMATSETVTKMPNQDATTSSSDLASKVIVTQSSVVEQTPIVTEMTQTTANLLVSTQFDKQLTIVEKPLVKPTVATRGTGENDNKENSETKEHSDIKKKVTQTKLPTTVAPKLTTVEPDTQQSMLAPIGLMSNEDSSTTKDPNQSQTTENTLATASSNIETDMASKVTKVPTTEKKKKGHRNRHRNHFHQQQQQFELEQEQLAQQHNKHPLLHKSTQTKKSTKRQKIQYIPATDPAWGFMPWDTYYDQYAAPIDAWAYGGGDFYPNPWEEAVTGWAYMPHKKKTLKPKKNHNKTLS